MAKLIRELQTNPTPAAIERARKYLLKHPMSVCLLIQGEIDVLRQHGLTN